MLQADQAQVMGQPCRTPPQIVGVPWLRADAGEADERGQVLDEARSSCPRMGNCPCDRAAGPAGAAPADPRARLRCRKPAGCKAAYAEDIGRAQAGHG